MRKIFFTLLVVFISVTASAQNAKAEKSAKNTTAKMKAELSLTDDEAAKVYDIMVIKYTKNIEIKQTYKDDATSKKKELSKSNKTAQKKVALVIGDERVAQWKAYLAANKKK